jgi:hypothetical protein
MGAEIEVRNVVKVVGHGTVLIGYVRSGTAVAGQATGPLSLADGADRQLVVKSVQKLSSTEGRGQAVGLVFVNGPRLEELREAAPAGSILALEGPGQ